MDKAIIIKPIINVFTDSLKSVLGHPRSKLECNYTQFTYKGGDFGGSILPKREPGLKKSF